MLSTILTLLMAKIYIFKLYEALVFPIATFIALKYSGSLHVAYIYSMAAVEYVYNYSTYTAVGISSSSYFTQLYKGFQIVRIANTANAFLNIPTEKFSIQFLKEVYHWAPCFRDTMTYTKAQGISFRMFPEVANSYLNLSSDSARVLLATMDYQQKFGTKDVALIALNTDKKKLMEEMLAVTSHHGNINCLLHMSGKSSKVGDGYAIVDAGTAIIKALS